jgi:hypothetical protein
MAGVAPKVVRDRLEADAGGERSTVEKATTKLSALDLVILFCAATGIDHAGVGILAQDVHSVAVRGFIVHDRKSGAYALTDSGRAILLAVLEDIGLR